MFGAYTTAGGMAISRLVFRFFWFGFSSVAVTYIYLKVLHERNDYSNDHSIFGYTVYAALRLVLALLLKFAACRLRANHLMTKSFTIPC
ncbi:putative 1,3-beta-glucan synthase [Rosa chinensis]|uniref:Putative 1,3-beta-glucan synthase n=1 Tax=Rosa chinensis TaxID=74649 RepID=A0A2P6P5B9_ROSCH|nr:putative 1,3-beta-glucan synthase [Rosa chinensis]